MWYKIVNLSSEEAEVYIYKPIGNSLFSASVSADKFISDIQSLKAKKLIVRINSPGGSIFDGIAIYNYLRTCDKEVETIVDGVAASIASVILMAGDVRRMAKNGMVMIHNPTGQVNSGDSKEMRKVADVLDSLRDQIVDIYQDRTEMSNEQLNRMMEKESWLDSKEAKEKGFITNIEKGLKAVACKELDRFSFSDRAERRNRKKIAVKEVMRMDLLDKFNVKNEAELEDYVNELRNENQRFKKQLADLKKLRNEMTIEMYVKEGKVAPYQKEIAEKLLNKDEKLFNEWLESNKPESPEKDELDIPDNSGSGKSKKDISFEDLLKDQKLHDEVKENDPKLYQKLYNSYIEEV